MLGNKTNWAPRFACLSVFPVYISRCQEKVHRDFILIFQNMANKSELANRPSLNKRLVINIKNEYYL